MRAGGLQHRPALDGLRGVAVAAVVVHHVAPGALPGGFLGVDLFFVLSGFLITSLLLDEHRHAGSIDLRAFWGRRARRLLPAAVVVLFAIVVVAALTGDGTTGLRADVLSSLLWVNNWQQIATGQSYVDLLAAPSPTRHFWSLAVEEQFYVLWPLVVAGGAALAGRRAWRRPRRVAVGLLLAGIAASALSMAAHYVPGEDPTRAYMGTDTRVFELLVGALLAVLVGHPDRVRRRVGVEVAAGVAVVAGAAALLRWDAVAPGYYRGGALAWALGAAVVILAVLPGGPLARVLGWRPLAALGVISYGVYLVHWPVVVFGDRWPIPVQLAVTLALALASYAVVETPIRSRRVLTRPAVARLAPIAAQLAVAALVIAVPLGGARVLSLTSGVDAAGASPTASPQATAIVVPPDLVRRPDQPDQDGPAGQDGQGNQAGSGDDGGQGERGGEVAQRDPNGPGGPAARADADGRDASTAGAGSAPSASRSGAAAMSGSGAAAAVAWTPPPPSPPRSLADAQHDADVSLISACAEQTQPVLAEYRSNGTGRLVAVLGDSMTVQMREAIFADRRFDWYVVARCGVGAWHIANLDAPSSVGLAAALDQLTALRPQALVVTLGVTDISRGLDPGDGIRAVVERTASVPCRSWVLLHAHHRLDPKTLDLEDRAERFNEQLAEVLDGTDVRLVDWGARVQAVPDAPDGYHPWLNPADGMHLLPGQGVEQRQQLHADAVC